MRAMFSSEADGQLPCSGEFLRPCFPFHRCPVADDTGRPAGVTFGVERSHQVGYVSINTCTNGEYINRGAQTDFKFIGVIERNTSTDSSDSKSCSNRPAFQWHGLSQIKSTSEAHTQGCPGVHHTLARRRPFRRNCDLELCEGLVLAKPNSSGIHVALLV